MIALTVMPKATHIDKVALAPDGAALCTRGENGLALWTVATGQRAGSELTDFRPGGSFCFHPSGRWLLGKHTSGALAAFDRETGETRVTPIGGGEIGRLVVTPDGGAVLCYFFGRSGRAGNGYRSLTWSATKLTPGWSVETFAGIAASGRYNCGLAVLADGERFATVDHQMSGSKSRLTIRAVATGEVLSAQDIEGTANPILAVSPGGEWFAVAAGAALFAFTADPATPPVRLPRKDRNHVTGIAFHPSGRYLAATGTHAVKLYDTTTWEVARTFAWKIGRTHSVAFSPDGTLAAVGSDRGKVVVWDVDL